MRIPLNQQFHSSSPSRVCHHEKGLCIFPIPCFYFCCPVLSDCFNRSLHWLSFPCIIQQPLSTFCVGWIMFALQLFYFGTFSLEPFVFGYPYFRSYLPLDIYSASIFGSFSFSSAIFRCAAFLTLDRATFNCRYQHVVWGHIRSRVCASTLDGWTKSSVNEDIIYLVLHYLLRPICWGPPNIKAARMTLEPCIYDSHVFFLTELQETIFCLAPCSKAMRSYYVFKSTSSYLGIKVSHNYIDIMFFS